MNAEGALAEGDDQLDDLRAARPREVHRRPRRRAPSSQPIELIRSPCGKKGICSFGEEFADYKLKVNRYINENGDKLIIHKLRNNLPMTQVEFDELERIFTEELGTKRDYRTAYERHSIRIAGAEDRRNSTTKPSWPHSPTSSTTRP